MAVRQDDGGIVLSTKVDTSGIIKGMNSLKGVVGKFGKLMAIAYSAKRIANFAKEAVGLYKIQMQNEVKLATVMRERVNATNEQIQSILDLTAAEQELGIIGDEVQIAGLQQLATFAKQTETIETLLPAMNNLIAQQYGFEASTSSAVNVANLMGKVLQGQTGALTRVGITFTEAQEEILKYGTESERAATLAEVITDNVGEMNKALANTDVGRQQQLANRIGDIKEQFGEAINQIAIVFLPLLRYVADVLQTIAELFRETATIMATSFGAKSNDDQWKNIAENIGDAAENEESLVENIEDANKALKKSLAGFDDLQILTAKTADSTESGEGNGGTAIFGELSGGSVKEEVDTTLGFIETLVGKALAAVGVILCCFGYFQVGLPVLAVGAAVYAKGLTSLSNSLPDNVKTTLGIISAIVGTALVAIGIVLLITGAGAAVGIGLIVAGLMSYGEGIALNWNYLSDKISSVWEDIESYWNANIQPSIDKAFGYINTEFGDLQDALEEFWTEVAKPVLDDVASVFLWLWRTILKPVVDFLIDAFEEALPFAIEAIGILVADAIDWLTLLINFMTDVFTGDWEGVWNDIGNIVKKVINKLMIDPLNVLIAGVNKIKIEVPNWDIFGDLKGKSWGMSIPKIPKLAQGGVIPPNREFLAVLGDQRSGTNIETPLPTMVEAFQMALDSRGNSMTREEHYYLNETELMKIMYRLAKGGERISGTSLVSGGGY